MNYDPKRRVKVVVKKSLMEPGEVGFEMEQDLRKYAGQIVTFEFIESLLIKHFDFGTSSEEEEAEEVKRRVPIIVSELAKHKILELLS